MREFQRSRKMSYRNNATSSLAKRKTAWSEKSTGNGIQQATCGRETAITTNYRIGLRKTIASDFENKIRYLSSKVRNGKNTPPGKKKELEFLQKEQALISREKRWRFRFKSNYGSRNQLADKSGKKSLIGLISGNWIPVKTRELEKQLDDQKKLADEMRRKPSRVRCSCRVKRRNCCWKKFWRIVFRSIQLWKWGRSWRSRLYVDHSQFSGYRMWQNYFWKQTYPGWQNVWSINLKMICEAPRLTWRY